MFLWILPIAAAIGVLLIFLIRLLQRYDAESAQLALTRVTELEEKMDELQQRLVTLEAIESDKLIPDEDAMNPHGLAESVSSVRSRTTEL